MYLERLLEKKVLDALRRNGAVLIEVAKAVGKTMLEQKMASSFIQIDISEDDIQNFKLNPKKVLEGEKPRCIDEWQIIPQLWNLVRKEIDETQKNNLFILTGSSSPLLENKNIHSGAFRISRLTLSTLTSTEKGFSEKKIDFKDLFEKKNSMNILKTIMKI
ncbi:MAG: AAA family ATPase [Mycoplasmataceae bacterium]|nr:AAA family ATPase [Mycoplasmataceae bacterium]